MAFDPYALPDQPVVRIDITLDRRGHEQVAVDGERITPDKGESARTAAIRQVAGRVDALAAAERNAGAGGAPRTGVRARLNGPGFTDYDIAVDRDGRLYVPVAPDAAPPPSAPPAAAPAPERVAQGSPPAPRGAGGGPGSGVDSGRQAGGATTTSRAAKTGLLRPGSGATPASASQAGASQAGASQAGASEPDTSDGAEPSASDANADAIRHAAAAAGAASDTPWSLTFLDTTDAEPPATSGRDRATARTPGSSLAAAARSKSTGTSRSSTPEAPTDPRRRLPHSTTARSTTGATTPSRTTTARSTTAATTTAGIATVEAPRSTADHTDTGVSAQVMEAMLPVHPQTLPRDRLGRLVRASRELRPCDPEPDAGDHIVGEDVRGSDPESGAATPASGRSERHRPTTRALRIRPAVLVVILAALLVLTAGAVIVYAALYPRDGRPGAAATPTPFPGTAAPGWSQQPRWVSPVLDPGGGRVVAVDDAIAYMRADRSVDLVDATTGVARWSAALPAGTLHGGLAATSIDGARVIAAQVDNTLAWWSLDKGAAGSIDLPDGAETTFLGGMPLVGLDARTVAVVSSGTLRQLSVPSGAYALAADAQGRVTAASGRGWWHLRPGVAPGAVTAWEQPSPDDDAADAAPQVVGYLGDSVLLLFPPDRAGSPHVVAYGDAADSQQLRVSFRGRAAVGPDAPSSPTASAGPSRERDPASGPPSGQPWWPSPSGTWGVLGRTLVDLRAGSVTDLGAWTTTWITSDRAYGTIDGKPVQAGPGVERTDVGATVTIPEVVTSAGAAMRAAGSDGERLYLLPPAT